MGSGYTPGHCSDYCKHANAKANRRASTQMVRSHLIHDLTGNLWCFGLAIQMERLILLIALVMLVVILAG